MPVSGWISHQIYPDMFNQGVFIQRVSTSLVMNSEQICINSKNTKFNILSIKYIIIKDTYFKYVNIQV